MNDLATQDEKDLPGVLRVCLPRERLFAETYINTGNAAQAAKVAGAECNSPQAYATVGNRYLNRPRVQAALDYLFKRALRSDLSGDALTAIREIIKSPFHKDRLKAALAVAGRIDPEITRIEGHVTHEIIDHETEALNQLRALKALGVAREKLIEVYGGFGLDRLEKKLALEEKSKPIDAEFTEVAPDPDAALLGEV
jgi:Terminase small subunit